MKISWRNYYFEGRKFKSYRGMGSVEGCKKVLRPLFPRCRR
jgi:hypothetical protein